MNRREFLRLLSKGLIIGASAPEELLWVPNRSRIFVSSMPRVPMSMSAIVAMEMERVAPYLKHMFERDETFFQEIFTRKIDIAAEKQMRTPLIIKPKGE